MPKKEIRRSELEEAMRDQTVEYPSIVSEDKLKNIMAEISQALRALAKSLESTPAADYFFKEAAQKILTQELRKKIGYEAFGMLADLKTELEAKLSPGGPNPAYFSKAAKTP